MNYLIGDIWKKAHFLADWVVVPTNIGWTKQGQNVMGRGIARQAKGRFPGIEDWYGEHCQEKRAAVGLQRGRFTGTQGGNNLIFFPTKPLNPVAPQLSWQQPSCMELIEKGLRDLSYFIPPVMGGQVMVPLLGCGNGGLEESKVWPLMKSILIGPCYAAVFRSKAEAKRAGAI